MIECINCKVEISEEQSKQSRQRCPSCFFKYEREKSKRLIKGGTIETVFGVVFIITWTIFLVLTGHLIPYLICIIIGGIMVLEGAIRLIRGLLIKQKILKRQAPA